MSTNFSFQLGLINSCLGFVANAIAFVLTAHFGRRTIFLYGLGFNIIALMALGVAASVNQSSATSYAQACLGVIISFNYAMSQ
jgi:SP family general alpha glucoside:H+ symporter-like MFS transporter